MQCLREIFLLSFDSETTFFWEDLCQRTTSFGGISVKGVRIYALPILDSAMRLEKAAPPRTPEQLAELGKYSDPDAQVAVRPG